MLLFDEAGSAAVNGTRLVNEKVLAEALLQDTGQY